MSVDLTHSHIEPRLTTRWLGRAYVYQAEIDSTNSYLAQLAREGAAHGTVVIADSQSQGRGRLQRTWNSPPGVNLYFSALLRPTWDGHARPPISLVAGVAMAEAVQACLDQPPTLKWPNDILVEGRKLAGILVEAAIAKQTVEQLVVGIGLNVNQTEFPEELSDIATSLQLAGDRAFNRGDVLVTALDRLEFWFNALANEPLSIIARWQQFAPWLGQSVSVVHGGRTLSGTALGLADSGALRLQDARGTVHDVLAGDAQLGG